MNARRLRSSKIGPLDYFILIACTMLQVVASSILIHFMEMKKKKTRDTANSNYVAFKSVTIGILYNMGVD